MKYVPLILPHYHQIQMNDIKNTLLLLQQYVTEGRDNSILLPIAKQIVEDLDTEGIETSFIQDISEYFPRLRWRIDGTEKMDVIPTGFRDIDNRVYGVAKWNIMTIAARTGWWKTTLWLNMAVNMTKNYKVGFISLEMTKDEILDKIISQVCRVKLNSLTINRFSQYDIQNIKERGAEAMEIVNKITFAFDCFHIDEITSVMWQMAELWVEVVFIDWLGLIEARGQSKPEQMREIMSKIKQAALSKNMAVVAMQQLWRQVDGEDPKGPFMRDIADGSAIEKVSSPVLIMRRSWEEDKTTDIRLFKMRRLNSDLLDTMYNDKTIVDPRYNFANIKLWEDLTYCQFTDKNSLHLNEVVEWTMPF